MESWGRMDEGGCGDAHERERQGEDGVGDLDEVGVRDQASFAGQDLAIDAAGPRPRRHGSLMPSFAHFSLTFARVASSIVIIPGHSRVKPSSGHFCVASIPILEP